MPRATRKNRSSGQQNGTDSLESSAL
jgi:hypothetical protein